MKDLELLDAEITPSGMTIFICPDDGYDEIVIKFTDLKNMLSEPVLVSSNEVQIKNTKVLRLHFQKK